MLPIRLEIKNFLAYRSPEPLIFEGIRLACLTGANGAGKSSLLDAITWVLWGKARGKGDDALVHLGQNDMHVQLDFEHEGATYRVLRQRTRKGSGKIYLDLFAVLENGQLETRSESALRATQQKITDLLRLDYETFVNSAFLQQGKADSFTTKTPAQRKEILADILGLARWEKYEKATKEKITAMTEAISRVDGILAGIDDELAKEPALRVALEAAKQAQLEAQAKLEAADAKLKEVEHAPADLRNAKARQGALERSLLDRQRELVAASAEIKTHQDRIAEFETVVSAREEIERGYATLQAARSVDGTLGEKLTLLKDFDEQRHALERELDKARGALETEAGRYESAIDQLERTISAARPDELSQVQAEILTLEDLDGQRDSFRLQAGELEKEQAELKGTNSGLFIEMNALKDRIGRLEAADGAVCPLCGQPLDESHLTEILDDLKVQGRERGDLYRTNQSRTGDIVKELSTYAARVKDLSQDLLRLDALRKRSANLQAAVDHASDAAGRLAEQQARLDAVMAQLNEQKFGARIRRQIADLDAQRDALGYDSQQHNTAREQLKTYRDYEVRQQKLLTALESLDGQKALLVDARGRCARIEGHIADDQQTLAEVIEEIAQLDVLVKEHQARESEARIARAQERAAQDKVIESRQGLKALDVQRIRKEELELKRDLQREERGLYEELRVAFGKNGIPAMIIETAIPELEVGANGILSRMTDGRMHLAIRTQREKVSGDLAETLDIQIADELGTRSYEMYSGGEAFRINFAVRVALSQLLARRAGAHLSTLFIDEGFGTQDEDGRNKLIDAINAVQDDFELILAITHIEELRDAFPVHIALEKTPDGSRISVR